MLKVIEQLFNVFFSSLSLQSFHSIYFCHGTNSVDFFCWLSLPPSCIKTTEEEREDLMVIKTLNGGLNKKL